MNHALTFRPQSPIRIGLVLMLSVTLWLATLAVSLAPTVARTARIASPAGDSDHSAVCHCAHCPGGAACCCRQSLKCPSSQ